MDPKMKQIVIGVVAFVAIGGFVYFNFLRGDGSAAGDDTAATAVRKVADAAGSANAKGSGTVRKAARGNASARTATRKANMDDGSADVATRKSDKRRNKTTKKKELPPWM